MCIFCPPADSFDAISFLDAPSYLYKRSCPSVRPSVRPYVPFYFRRWKVRILGASCAVYPSLFFFSFPPCFPSFPPFFPYFLPSFLPFFFAFFLHPYSPSFPSFLTFLFFSSFFHFLLFPSSFLSSFLSSVLSSVLSFLLPSPHSSFFSIFIFFFPFLSPSFLSFSPSSLSWLPFFIFSSPRSFYIWWTNPFSLQFSDDRAHAELVAKSKDLESRFIELKTENQTLQVQTETLEKELTDALAAKK